ncbi:hypothetical protein BRADI_4g13785v3 [Brachypodium distachyon]|uniref:Uncharacterized protein n=1 Tax=Brachypodium distachyon TaxID=15368 RepID=A0A2K2CMN4_BRADI|nr:hypothetical protein BRADI_4g13785v3 [Brachypodium distachyon]
MEKATAYETIVSWLHSLPGVVYSMELADLAVCFFVILVFFLVGSAMNQQIDKLPCKGCVPGQSAFNNIRFSSVAVSDSCGYSKTIRLVQLVQFWSSTISSPET